MRGKDQENLNNENPVDIGAWQAAVPGVTKSPTQLSTHISD